MSTHADRETGNNFLKLRVLCEVCRVGAGIGVEIDNSSSKYWSWALQDIWSQSSRHYSLLRAFLSFGSYPAQLSSFLCRTQNSFTACDNAVWNSTTEAARSELRKLCDIEFFIEDWTNQRTFLSFQLSQNRHLNLLGSFVVGFEGWLPVYMIQSVPNANDLRPITIISLVVH